MRAHAPASTPFPSEAACLDSTRGALQLLLQAWDFAVNLGLPGWQFALEIQNLRAVGTTDSALRWLVHRGYVQYGTEVGAGRKGLRRFRPATSLRFGEKTCFVLNRSKLPVVRQLVPGLAGEGRREPRTARAGASGTGIGRIPRWDRQCRELWVGPLLVKRFRQPAVAQETVLSTFEEEGWPLRIDDPLPPLYDQEPKRRLHDTIKSLNRNQVHSMLHFRGDGQGCGVRWELGHR
jgi:hypothetical protein